MRKKSLTFILAAAMMFSMTACGGSKRTETVEMPEKEIIIDDEESEDEETSEEETPVEQDEVEEGLVDEADAEEEEEEVDTEEEDSEEQKVSGRYERGTYIGNAWESEWLGIRYEKPDGFVVASEDELEAMIMAGGEIMYEDDAQTAIDYAKLTTVYELMVLAPSGNPNFNLAVERSAYAPDEYMEILEQQLSMVNNISVDWKGYEGTEEIGGIEFDKYNVETDYGGLIAKQTYYITEKENRLVYIVLTYTDDTEDDVDALMSGFSAL